MGNIKIIEQGSVLSNPKQEAIEKTKEGTTISHTWDIIVGGQNKGVITREIFTNLKGKSKTRVFMVDGSRTQSIRTCLKKNGLPPVQEKR